MNKVILMGRLTREPEVRYSNGAEPLAVARYTLAVNRRFKRKDEPEADFIPCVAFGKSGEFDGEIFRERIRLLREKNGMTKKDFAAFTGIAYITLYNYEREKTVPGADMLFRIASATGCSVDWLIGLKEEEGKCRR